MGPGRNKYLQKGDSILNLAGGQGMGVGNVYRVIKSSESYFNDFRADHDFEYSDGSRSVHADDGSGDGIQSALDACVANRNDYVIVQPSESDYDLTAVLTLSKKSVHLLCPAGFGLERGSTNAARLEQTTASTEIFIVSGASVEIAGFYLKHKQNVTAIQLNTAGAYAPNIHHNNIAMNTTSTTSQAMIHAVGDGGAYGDIHHNWIYSSGGNDTTIAAIIAIAASATMAEVTNNQITIGDGLTATVGIQNLATKGMVADNRFGQAGADSTWTHCIQVSSFGNAIGNRGVVADGIIVVGGASDSSFSDNMNGVNGGLIDDED
ncbi:hypothetical protein LCGC14_2294320 [marine sediment metagenome]|uniref:Pectate lyase superfamily protein domain-containing protein n=1 Tax=marine sediment metagenome TaxID=412755 RepID=A0A0F9F2S9_9ZZZZ